LKHIAAASLGGDASSGAEAAEVMLELIGTLNH
jgi:hypothetical protein